MGVYETFSKRMKRRERAGQTDVYQYDSLPERFRIQVLHIWGTAIGVFKESSQWDYDEQPPKSNRIWDFLHHTMSRELGVPGLGTSGDAATRCREFLVKADTLHALDIIEMSFRLIDTEIRSWTAYFREKSLITQSADEAIYELNHRFREHIIGYQYENGEIIRVDSQYVHSEAVKPAMSLLNAEGFEGASEEFMKAHEHYRNGRNKEAIADALKSFESVLKTICDKCQWSYPSNATAKPLLDIVFQNGLIPRSLQSQFGSLRSLLESGLPTVSNPERHGQGSTVTTIPSHVAAYALHLAASDIVFLVESHKTLP